MINMNRVNYVAQFSTYLVFEIKLMIDYLNVFNPSNAEATFVQSTRTQKIEKHLNPVMLVFIG